MVRFETSHGAFTVELFAQQAPITVENFLRYVDDGHFDGTIFHRIVPGFVIQGGGLTADFASKKTRAPISNEAKNGLKNTRGSLSMARTSDISSATSQFFVNLSDNAFLDHGPRDYGYAVFGRVSAGMDVIDKIARVSTGRRSGYQDAPLEGVVIVSARRLQAASARAPHPPPARRWQSSLSGSRRSSTGGAAARTAGGVSAAASPDGC